MHLFGILLLVWLVVHGIRLIQRSRKEVPGRRRYLVMGLAIVGVTGSLLTLLVVPTAMSVNWYRYKPTAWLLSELADPDYSWIPEDVFAMSPGNGIHACRELRRRLESGWLDRSEIEALASILYSDGLGCPSACSTNGCRSVGYRTLQALDAHGVITPSQKACFFEGLLDVTLSVRPVSFAAIGIPAVIEIAPRGRWSDWWYVRPDIEVVSDGSSLAPKTEVLPDLWCLIHIEALRVDEVPIDLGQVGGKLRHVAEVALTRHDQEAWVGQAIEVDAWHAQCLAMWLPSGPIEHCRIEMMLWCRFYTECPSDNPDAVPVWEITRPLSAASRVVDAQPEQALPQVSGSDYEAKTFRARVVGFPVRGQPNVLQCEATLEVEETGTGLAFDVRIEVEGQAIDAGTMCLAKGASGKWWLPVFRVSSECMACVIVLMPSVDVAARSTEITEFWGNPIRIHAAIAKPAPYR